MKNTIAKGVATLGLIMLTCACGGGGADLSPEIVQQLDVYEDLITEFEPKFAAVRGNAPEFAKVAESYQQRTQVWINGLQSAAPDPTEEEGRAIKARVEKLNKRALRMLAG